MKPRRTVLHPEERRHGHRAAVHVHADLAPKVRYVDDFVVGFQHQSDAERFLRDLRVRLARFGLDLHPEKTRLIEFGRFAARDRTARGLGKPQTFDFLGFTHVCGKTRDGRLWLKQSRCGPG
jgi:hypothetical protein